MVALQMHVACREGREREGTCIMVMHRLRWSVAYSSEGIRQEFCMRPPQASECKVLGLETKSAPVRATFIDILAGKSLLRSKDRGPASSGPLGLIALPMTPSHQHLCIRSY